MQKTKKLFLTGAFVSLAVAIFTILGVVMSYASPAEAVDPAPDKFITAETNEQLSITFNTSGEAVYDRDYGFEVKGDEGYVWDPATRSLIFNNSVESYTIKNVSGSISDLDIFYKYNGKECRIIFHVNVNNENYRVVGLDFPQGFQEKSSDVTVKVGYPDVSGVKAVTIYGRVYDYMTEQGLGDAEIKFGNKITGDIFATTTSNSNGEFTFNRVPIEDLKAKILSKELCVYATYPGYAFEYDFFVFDDVKKVIDDEAIISTKLELSKAVVDVQGNEHHKDFTFSLLVYMNGELLTEDSMNLNLDHVGINEEMLKDLDLDLLIDENGVMSCSREMGNAYVNEGGLSLTVSVAPHCEEGYAFDYVEIGGVQYKTGDSFKLNATSDYAAQVYYKPATDDPTPENAEVTGTAQTGDAIPFAVLIALGIIAGLSVVSIRKFSK